MTVSWKVIGLDSDRAIAGVQRLSDGKVFYLNDKTTYGCIRKFIVEDSDMKVYLGGSSLYGIDELKRFSIMSISAL